MIICTVCAALFGVIVVAVWWSVHRVPLFPINGCCALVTGGSLGIGLETARELVRRGARLVIIAARNEETLKTAVEELRTEVVGKDTKVEYVVMDVADETSVSRALEEVMRTLQTTGKAALDLVVCNAGFSVPSRFVDITPAEGRRMMDVNFFGCVNVVRAVLPSMLQQRGGRFVFVSSLAARCPLAGYSIYAASKAAIRAFAHSLDMENSYKGVRCQVISPPDVYTPGLEQENLRKSPECSALSSFGGDAPVTAADMGRRVTNSIVNYRFDESIGFDKQLLCWAVAGKEEEAGASGDRTIEEESLKTERSDRFRVTHVAHPCGHVVDVGDYIARHMDYRISVDSVVVENAMDIAVSEERRTTNFFFGDV